MSTSASARGIYENEMAFKMAFDRGVRVLRVGSGSRSGAGPQGGVRQEGEAAEHTEGARGGRGPRDQGFLHKVREDQETFRILPFKGK